MRLPGAEPRLFGQARHSSSFPRMTASSDLAELSTLCTLLEDIVARIETMANRYGATPDSAVAADLYNAERGLVSARRALDRASASVAHLTR